MISLKRDPSTGSVLVLPEPLLSFRYGEQTEDPRDGLALFGPSDGDDPSHRGSLPYGVVGPADIVEAYERFSGILANAVVQAPKDNTRLWPPYPGFEAVFSTVLPRRPSHVQLLDRAKLLAAARDADKYKRAYDLVTAYLQGIEAIAGADDPPSVIVCLVPEDLSRFCRPMSRVPSPSGQRLTLGDRQSRMRGQFELFSAFNPEQYHASVDFRRQLKARALKFGVPLQIVRETTLRVNDDVPMGGRRLTPLSNRAWNLATALYYKAGGRPWRLHGAREGVCYVGLAFRQAPNDGDVRTACCAAQLFLQSGEGVVFKGQLGPWYSPQKREFHLSGDAAESLLRGTIATYQAEHGMPLREVFLHSRSGISRDEYAGYMRALPPDVRLVGIRVRSERDGPRLFRAGRFPVLRGTCWRRHPRTCYLWATGTKPRMGTYDGADIPAPLRIDIQHGDADIDLVAKDILALTKLNFNACKLGDGRPVTIKFSDSVGEILVSNPMVTERRPNFRFYI